MTPELYQALQARAKGSCESCGVSLSHAGREVDHAFGRPPRADENVATCWVLCPRCHFSKTTNFPSAAHWLERFAKHCAKHFYFESQQRAEARLHFVETRGTFSSALGKRR